MKKVNSSCKISNDMRKHILALYYEDNRMPMRIHRMTGIPLDTVKDIIYRRRRKDP